MLTERSADAVIVRAPAKVNLFLEVLARRADGYHDIATLMATVGLRDRLEFRDEPSGQLVLHCDRPDLSTGQDNLICRAAASLKRHTGTRRGARIWLEKRIPMAAGLAGGSSDAAATLEGLNQLWGLGLPRAELAALGAEIGSDVPFFFAGPAAWCTGRGEVVTPATIGRPLDFVLACPSVGISTVAVYRACTVPDEPVSGDALRAALAARDVEALGRQLHNRLQPAAEGLCPEVAALYARVAALRPAGQMMSGSGSTVFALCRDRREAIRVARALCASPGESGLNLFLVRSCV